MCCDSAGEASLDWQRDRRREGGKGGKRGRASLHGPLYLLWPRFERDLEAGQLFEFRGMPGSSEAWQRLRWKRDRPSVPTPKCHSTWQTASFFPCVPFFLSLRTLQRFKHFILFFLLKQFFLLKSLTWLQPGGLFFFFFHESGTTCVFKTCRGWNNWLRGDVFFFFLSSKLDSAIDCFSFFLLKRNVQRGNGRK